MTYALVYTKSFKKDLKLLKKRKYDMEKLQTLLDLLAKGKPLPAKYKDHRLQGDKKTSANVTSHQTGC